MHLNLTPHHPAMHPGRRHQRRNPRFFPFRRASYVRPRSFVALCLIVGIGYACSLFSAHKKELLAAWKPSNYQTIFDWAFLESPIETRDNVTESKIRIKKFIHVQKPLGFTTSNQTDPVFGTTTGAPAIPAKATSRSDQGNEFNSSIVTVAYVVSLVSCGTRRDGSLYHITEGGAVLKHSVHRASIRGTLGGRYDYKFYAIYHPNASDCAPLLADMGYELIQRDTPVRVEDIRGDGLRNSIRGEGCCGEKELIKLEAYKLTSHPIVVHLDLDTVVLKPMDAIFDLMLTESADNQTFPRGSSNSTVLSNIPLMWPGRPIPTKTNFMFTRDYNMITPLSAQLQEKYPPIQGGFLVLRPDINVYHQFIDVILEGNFKRYVGWGGVMGYFYGHATIQGLLPYFYDLRHPGQSVELNRCVYNVMSDNPVFDIGVFNGTCKTGQKTCEDCRVRPLEDIVTAHFTFCSKPWLCLGNDADIIELRLCKKLTHEWYRIRSELEQSRGKSGWGTGKWNRDDFFGFCIDSTPEGYQTINVTWTI